MTDNKHGVNPVVAGLAGAAVGAVAGIAAVEVAKNHEAIGHKFGEIKEKGEEVVDKLKETVSEAKDKLEEVSTLAGDENAKDGTQKKAA